MAYTPELSQKHSATLRRIAWAMQRPMTVTLEGIFDWIGKAVDAGKVCPSCRDRTLCEKCVFNKSDQTIRAT